MSRADGCVVRPPSGRRRWDRTSSRRSVMVKKRRVTLGAGLLRRHRLHTDHFLTRRDVLGIASDRHHRSTRITRYTGQSLQRRVDRPGRSDIRALRHQPSQPEGHLLSTLIHTHHRSCRKASKNLTFVVAAAMPRMADVRRCPWRSTQIAGHGAAPIDAVRSAEGSPRVPASTYRRRFAFACAPSPLDLSLT